MDLKSAQLEFNQKLLLLIEMVERTTEVKWKIVEQLRSMERQKQLYNQPTDGIDNDGDGQVDEADEKVTNAKPGQSAHNYALAADCYPLRGAKIWWAPPASVWNAYGTIAEGLGLVWGGRFKSIPGGDAPHVEFKDWRNFREAK